MTNDDDETIMRQSDRPLLSVII